ncbi:MAG: menaquinone biosynthesis protein [Planctomycetes bacterium]|nr:menaquinone biosynthesis protein [Planctomycetota bacterium]
MKQQQTDYRLGAVSFLNTKPLIEGLAGEPGVQLELAVPAELAGMLQAGCVDAALVPVIDIGRAGGRWKRISDAGIGSNGDTLTVQVFSRVQPENMTTLHADTHSHTSVILAQLVWKGFHRRPLTVVPLKPETGVKQCESVLLIGDKVVGADVGSFQYRVDLGGAWRAWTGLPFVFAAWAAPVDRETSRLAQLLSQARDRGVARAAELAVEHGPALRWPVDLARDYLTRLMKYTITPAAEAGMNKFLELARVEGLIPKPGVLVK